MVEYQNENLVALLDGEPMTTAPDLIMSLDMESGTPGHHRGAEVRRAHRRGGHALRPRNGARPKAWPSSGRAPSATTSTTFPWRIAWRPARLRGGTVMSLDNLRNWRLGIDVGGTNTDAVIIDGDLNLIAATKSPTTEDVMDGIKAAMHEVLSQIGGDAAAEHRLRHVGNHALHQRHRRAQAPEQGGGHPPGRARDDRHQLHGRLADVLKDAMRVRDFLAHGGNEFDGREISAIDEDELREIATVIRDEGVESAAVVGVFSPGVRRAREARAAILADMLGEDFPITLSSEIGSLGFLERENASILNAALHDVAHTTASSFQKALGGGGLADIAVYLCQNDGTLMSVDYAKRYPIFTIACGPTNSIRGASFLTNELDAVVVDIGGTTTDVGVLAHGFPAREHDRRRDRRRAHELPHARPGVGRTRRRLDRAHGRRRARVTVGPTASATRSPRRRFASAERRSPPPTSWWRRASPKESGIPRLWRTSTRTWSKAPTPR